MPPESKWEYVAGQDLARNKESGIYYAVKHFRGMPALNKSTGETDIRKAKKRLPQLIRDHLERYETGKRPAGSSPTVGQVIDEITATAGDRKPLRTKTAKKRAFYFERIRTEMELGSLPIEKLELPVWTARLNRVREKRERKTYRDYVKMANILIKYAYDRKYISHYITLPNPDGPAKKGVVFSKQELEWLWAEMGEDTRDQYVLAYECCMRLREALHLEWDRVDLETGKVRFGAEHVKTGSKTGKGREIYLTPHALERLRARRARQGAGKWVFPSPTGQGPIEDNKKAWNAAKDRVARKHPGFQHWGTWHHLRHSAITKLLVVVKMNVALVSEYVGTSIATLQRVYLHSMAEHTRGVTESLRITD